MKVIMDATVEDHQEGRIVLRLDTKFGDPCVPVAEECVAFPDLPAVFAALRKDGCGLTLDQEVHISKAIGLPRVNP